MIELPVTIEDFDTQKTHYLKLPCFVKDFVNITHDIQITAWAMSRQIDFCHDIESLNEVIEDINCENPGLTMKMLEEIMRITGCGLSDRWFVERLCSNDFMLEELDISQYKVGLTSIHDKCAFYLAVELGIPFAKNIGNLMSDIKTHPASRYDWSLIWKCYKEMGFETLSIDKNIYIFNWNNAI